MATKHNTSGYWESRFKEFDEGGYLSNGELVTYKKKNEYAPTYVTAPQGKVFFNGVLIDECFDIQYQYTETKEPIYGYNSKHFDAIMAGVVVIQGAFSINYKHDAYLHEALHYASGELNYNGKSSRQQAIDKKEEMRRSQDTYRATLSGMRDLRLQKRELETELKNIDKKVLDAEAIVVTRTQKKATFTGSNGYLVNQTKQAEEKFREFYSKLEIGEELEIKKQIADIEKTKNIFETKQGNTDNLQSRIKTALDEETRFLGNANKELEKLKETLSEYETIIQSYVSRKGSGSLIDRLTPMEQIELVKTKETLIPAQIGLIDSQEDKISNLNKLISKLTKQLSKAQSKDRDLKEDFNDDIINKLDNYPKAKEYLTLRANIDILKKQEFIVSGNIDDEIQEARKSLDTIRAEKDKISKAISDITAIASASLENVKKTKESVDAINSAIAKDYEMEDTYISKSWQRAEDHEDFNILLEYNGSYHKALMHCQLTGHSHALAHDSEGRPIREVYTFIAKELNSDH
jgi:hypothetical protein